MDNNKIILWCDRVIRFSFCALIYFLPISIALVEIFSNITLVFFFIKRGVIFRLKLRESLRDGRRMDWPGKLKLFWSSFKPLKNDLNWPIAIFVFINFLSLVFSQDHTLSLQGFFFKLLQGVYLCFVFVDSFKNKKQVSVFLLVCLLAGTLISTSGVVQYVTGKDFIHGHGLMPDKRIVSSFRNSNDLAAYLVFLIPVVLILLLNVSALKEFISQFVRRRSPGLAIFFPVWIWLFIVFILMYFCLGLTFVRGGWIAFFVSLIFLGWRNKKSLGFYFVVILVFLSVFHPRLLQVRRVALVSDDGGVSVKKGAKDSTPAVSGKSVALLEGENQEEFLGGERQSHQKSFWGRAMALFEKCGGSGRSSFWKEPLLIIKDYPFLGVGINTYSKEGMRYKISWGGYPHNCYLQMAAETGMLGLLSFLGIIVVIFKQTLKNFKRMRDDLLRWVMLGFLTGLLGFLTHIFFDTSFYSVQLGNMMWLLIGVIIALQKIGLETSERE
ncbi:MAG: O-antigen ligase family protein [Candidatus Omnitrophota bacterium]